MRVRAGTVTPLQDRASTTSLWNADPSPPSSQTIHPFYSHPCVGSLSELATPFPSGCWGRTERARGASTLVALQDSVRGRTAHDDRFTAYYTHSCVGAADAYGYPVQFSGKERKAG